MENNACLKNKRLVMNHLALMSTTEKMRFIRNCKERKPAKNDHYKAEYKRAIDGMGCTDGWSRQFSKGTGPLHEIFYFRHSRYFDGAMFSRSDVNESLLNYCRNAMVHLKEELIRSGIYKKRVRDDFLVKSVMSQFEKQLLSFQVQIHKRNPGLIRQGKR
ncbi:RNA 3'-terminal phosphate cyclase/enolpyruvatetransferase [Striga asiatica]|uniref:RNA 3'-terminal phosphate cyclase/enolpyruvatetransferase n=1 Tax=Striga asiatica TaxID=4170 RepID=A0A5A7QMH4_STRAF|nr:RNA 3'-terminal phosphate cyclase/enolpyruvatetransferase [Striga asiatica]